MGYSYFKEEKKIWKKGYRKVVGLDEAGRGPLAGPVVAAAVTIRQFPISLDDAKRRTPRKVVLQFSKIKDSKKLTSIQREKFYKVLTNHLQIKWGIGKVSEKVIDRINILEATKLAMEKAVINLEKKIKKVDFLILDGNFKINSSTLRYTQGGERSRTIPQKSIIKADDKVFSCMAASIIAKVTRDRIMQKYHRKYPKYGFDRHKGYPTKYHFRMLKKHKPCLIHRQSFGPVREVT